MLNPFQHDKNLQKPISITAVSSLSSLGKSPKEVWKSYLNNEHVITQRDFNGKKVFVSEISGTTNQEIQYLRQSDSKYKSLDDSVLFAMYASRETIKQAGWHASDNFGVNIGSSRGATGLFEKYHSDFLNRGKARTLSSPTTTLGNLSSWVAHDLQTKGPEISHSITCSTALHALLNGIAWINSGMCNKFLVGGSEAPLTSFTIAQMQALKIYSKENGDFPCLALDLNKKQNTMVLGEGASMVSLEAGEKQKALAKIIGYGFATEILEHNVSLSIDAECFQKSMIMALKGFNNEEVDVIVTHTPGTIKGDLSEINAIKKVFSNKTPVLTTNKWKMGHTFGASGTFSLEMALLMLKNQKFIDVPYLNQKPPEKLENILINAVGFGGNAVSILLSKN